MKKALFIIASSLCLIFSADSCKKNDSGVLVEAIVTCKNSSSGSFYLQLDDKTILEPNNMTSSPYSEQTRAYVYFYDYNKVTESGDIQTRKVDITAMSKVLTKKPVASEGTEVDPVKYGNDPMDIVNCYATVVEDGYITFYFRSPWGATGATHTFNLVKNVDPQNPYLFELRQNYNGDIPAVSVYLFGTVAFDISDIISDKEKTYEISVRHIGTDNITKTAKFNYKFGTSAFIDTSNTEVTFDSGSTSSLVGSYE